MTEPSIPLTPREQQVAQLLADGLTYPQIADELSRAGRHVTVRTIRAHVHAIATKLPPVNGTQVSRGKARVMLWAYGRYR